ncbi:type IV secretion system protein VirD4 [Roseovarius sp. MBR-78]|jgi:type IV secretion system protein VirD4|uniref:type IV secretory system conjugative DNA transfer family protein n=1 Tax=Roseovarius sp. MBR-78 TaxID=3156460 RepID=UPI00339408D7
MSFIRVLWRTLRFVVFDLPKWILILAGFFVFLHYAAQTPLGAWAIAAVAAVVALPVLVGLWRYMRRPRQAYGSASFAKGRELRKAGLLTSKGPIIGKRDGRFLRYARPGHLLTFAPTRSGKGIGAVVPNLLDHPGSVFVTDIKGENYRIAGGYRAELGRIVVFAPFDSTLSNAFFNPVDFIRVGTPNEVDDARLMAEMIVAPNVVTADHWEREARVLIIGLLLHIARDLEDEERTLRQLRVMLMRSRMGFDEALAAMMGSASETAARIAEGFSQKEDKERSAVISTAQGCTEIFESPQLAEMTGRSSFRFEQIKEHTFSVFLIVPPEFVAAYQPFMRLMVGIATAAMSRNTRTPDTPVLFLLDELPALGRMRPIEDGIGYLAGYGVRLWLFVQDLDQLQKTYHKWRSMIANCAVRQAFNVQDPETANMLSNMLGQRTVKVRSGGRSGRFAWLGLPASFSESESETGRPLLSPSEVTLLPDSRMLVFVQGCRPILAEKLRYYADAVFQRRLSRPAEAAEDAAKNSLNPEILKG